MTAPTAYCPMCCTAWAAWPGASHVCTTVNRTSTNPIPDMRCAVRSEHPWPFDGPEPPSCIEAVLTLEARVRTLESVRQEAGMALSWCPDCRGGGLLEGEPCVNCGALRDALRDAEG